MTIQEQKQELFDRVVAHAQTMTEKSWDEEVDLCRYRMPDGNRCFIGGLIPDSEYSPKFERETPNFGRHAEEIRKAAGIPDDLAEFASDLQQIHDNKSMEKWPLSFEKFAHEHGIRFDRASYKQAVA